MSSTIAYLFHRSRRPKIGRKIQITWLPCNNAYPTKNVYIGTEGVVKEHYYGNNGFGLYTGNSWLIVYGDYRYKRF